MRIRIILTLIFLASCKQSITTTEKKTLDLGAFTIETPTGWKVIPRRGIDSYTGQIVLDRQDTISFNYGNFSSNLSEYIPFIIYKGNVHSSMDTSDMIIMDTKFWDPDKFRKNNIYWDTISGYQAKIVIPIKPRQGTTGVYFDSCGLYYKQKANFNLYGNNLNPQNQKELLLAIQTVKFKKG